MVLLKIEPPQSKSRSILAQIDKKNKLKKIVDYFLFLFQDLNDLGMPLKDILFKVASLIAFL